MKTLSLDRHTGTNRTPNAKMTYNAPLESYWQVRKFNLTRNARFADWPLSQEGNDRWHHEKVPSRLQTDVVINGAP
jgi:hypothetical protein